MNFSKVNQLIQGPNANQLFISFSHSWLFHTYLQLRTTLWSLLNWLVLSLPTLPCHCFPWNPGKTSWLMLPFSSFAWGQLQGFVTWLSSPQVPSLEHCFLSDNHLLVCWLYGSNSLEHIKIGYESKIQVTSYIILDTFLSLCLLNNKCGVILLRLITKIKK